MIKTSPLSPYAGLDVSGVDLEKEVPASVQDEIRRAWISAGILLFRGAGTSADVHLRLSRIFGEPEPAATRSYNLDDNPYIMQLELDPEKPRHDATVYEVGGERVFGYTPWHWDQAFMPTIVRGAVLRMIEPAARGGQTGFIDAIGAYERLPDSLKARIENLEIVYHYADSAEHVTRLGIGLSKCARVLEEAPRSEMQRKFSEFPPTVHPLVITQQETGRKVLKYSPLHSQYVLGMDRAEGLALLAEISEYLTDERYAYFHDWAANDMIVWDNWRIIHTACGAPPDVKRYAERTTIVGDYDLGRYLDPSLDKNQKVISYAD